jgi:hypothetical protein
MKAMTSRQAELYLAEIVNGKPMPPRWPGYDIETQTGLHLQVRAPGLQLGKNSVTPRLHVTRLLGENRDSRYDRLIVITDKYQTSEFIFFDFPFEWIKKSAWIRNYEIYIPLVLRSVAAEYLHKNFESTSRSLLPDTSEPDPRRSN